jgi:hypothetical protein
MRWAYGRDADQTAHELVTSLSAESHLIESGPASFPSRGMHIFRRDSRP